MDACSSLLAAPSYGLGAAGPFDACTPPPAPTEAARRALFSSWPNYPSVSGDPSMLGPRAPPTFSPYTPGSGTSPYGSAFADIAAFGPPPPPQRSNLSAFYPSPSATGVNGSCSTSGDSAAYGPGPYHAHHQSSGQQQQQGSASHHHPASSAAVAAALHGSRLLLSDLQTAAAAVGAMPPPPSLTNSRYDSVDPLCYLNDVVTGSASHNAGNTLHTIYICIDPFGFLDRPLSCKVKGLVFCYTSCLSSVRPFVCPSVTDVVWLNPER